ncbi:Peptide chain release factor 2 [Candidatus Tremblaya phenacola PAVE]|nr:Peptide chain release factor 2 [Candidatus Tremblaya phenacola PAVE]
MEGSKNQLVRQIKLHFGLDDKQKRLKQIGCFLTKTKSEKERAPLKAEKESILRMLEEINNLSTRMLVGNLEVDYDELVRALEAKFPFRDSDDFLGCLIELTPGAGGLESYDWVKLLMRQYMRFSERRGFKVEAIEKLECYPGFKKVLLKITGCCAYGLLRNETGVHRLIRKSPFSSGTLRHTSFAGVVVFPLQKENSTTEALNPSDLRIDTFRASGAGGQHVNKTDSAVRITHLPTGIVVQCQNDRSQHRNKSNAVEALTTKIRLLNKEKAEGAAPKLHAPNSWSSQIRSYILDKNRVKDARSGIESNDAKSVLEGNIDAFVNANLGKRF